MALMWYVPFEGPPRFVKEKPCSFEEHLSISPTLIVLYNINMGNPIPNPTLKPFGHILSNIPGDALFIAEGISSGEPEDISLTIESELPGILEKDTQQRNLFYRWTQDTGIGVVNL